MVLHLRLILLVEIVIYSTQCKLNMRRILIEYNIILMPLSVVFNEVNLGKPHTSKLNNDFLFENCSVLKALKISGGSRIS